MSDCGRRQIGMHQIGMQTQPDGRVTQTGLEIGTQGARDSRVSLGGVPGQARPSLAREAGIEKAESDARGAGEPANMVIPLSSSGPSGRGSGLS